MPTFIINFFALLFTAHEGYFLLYVAFYFSGFVVPTIALSIVKISGVEHFAKTRAIANIFGAMSNMVATPLTGKIETLFFQMNAS